MYQMMDQRIYHTSNGPCVIVLQKAGTNWPDNAVCHGLCRLVGQLSVDNPGAEETQ